MLIWDDLRVLLAIADRGSVTAAAKALGIDKATVSRRIGVLEAALGVRAFDRKASGWTLTTAGQSALTAARKAQVAVVGLLDELGAETGGTRVPVRLTAPLWFCSEVLLAHVPSFQKAAPWIDLNLSARSRLADLAEREAEVGLRNVRPARGEFVVRKAGELGSAIYGARSRYARRPPMGRGEILREPLIGYPDRITYVKGFSWLDEAKVATSLRVDDALAIAAAIRAGAGIGIVPCVLGDRDPDLMRLTQDRHSDLIWLVAPTDVARTRAVRTVMSFVADVFSTNAKALRG